MGAILALASALCYGTSDFTAGLAARRYVTGPVALAAQLIGLIVVVIASVLGGGRGVTVAALIWGALAGLGSGAGTLALYRGLAVGRMSVVATLSAVLSAVIPVLVGVALGNDLGPPSIVGIVLAIPAVALVSSQGTEVDSGGSGAVYGVLAGLGFALLLISIDRAGNAYGAKPLIASQLVGIAVVAPLAIRDVRRVARPDGRSLWLMLATGSLGAAGTLLYLSSTGHGQLAVISVTASMYPAVTVILARTVLAEHWNRLQVIGLLTALVAVILVGIG